MNIDPRPVVSTKISIFGLMPPHPSFSLHCPEVLRLDAFCSQTNLNLSVLFVRLTYDLDILTHLLLPLAGKGKEAEAYSKKLWLSFLIKKHLVLYNLFFCLFLSNIHIGSDETLDDNDKAGMVPILYQQVGILCQETQYRSRVHEDHCARVFPLLKNKHNGVFGHS
jgi:hypothetical protein